MRFLILAALGLSPAPLLGAGVANAGRVVSWPKTLIGMDTLILVFAEMEWSKNFWSIALY